jgi:CheY-like chemotaxis protein
MTHKTRIFLVDDDPIFRLLTKKTITSTGINAEVIEFVNGQQAMEYIEQNMDKPAMLPDTIFLDLNMPVLDGWGFLREYEILLPFIRKTSKLYILSSSMSPIDVERAANIPFVKDYLVKPMTKQQITELITASMPDAFHYEKNNSEVPKYTVINGCPAIAPTPSQWRRTMGM